MINADGTELATIIGSETYDNNSSSKITLGAAVETADATARSKAIKVTGNALDNYFTATTFNINGNNYQISGTKLVKK